jgi:hypothetical protein
MAALDSSNVINVEASLNHWLNTQLAAITKPAWLPTLRIVFNVPETGIVTPAISVTHLGGVTRKRYQGNFVGENKTGAAAFGLLDISCWVSRANTVSGQDVSRAQLMTLRAFVNEVFAGVKTVAIANYVTDQTGNTGTNYRVVFGDLDMQVTALDPNPDILRARYLLRYDWTMRGSNT